MKLPDYYKEKWFILFSHPTYFTSICTTEFVEFARMYSKFKESGVELIGLSLDQIYSHVKWVEWMKERAKNRYPIPIIADRLGKLASMLGMIPKKGTVL